MTKHLILNTIGGLVLTALVSAPAWAVAAPAAVPDVPANQNPSTIVPGTINYVEGQVSVGDQALTTKSVGSTVAAGESLTTGNGKVEVLLTPGVFLRVGSGSKVKMVSPGLADTEVAVDRGDAMVEVTQLHPQNDLRVDEAGIPIQILKTGLYDFDADEYQARVYKGEAVVPEGDKNIKLKGDHEISLNVDGQAKPQEFKTAEYESDSLYRWSSLRSAYEAEANVDAANMYVNYGWWGPGWYWDPWFSAFTFIPGDGIFYSPFGWGFYSPWFVYDAPIGFYGHYYHAFGPNYRAWGPGGYYNPGIFGGGFRGAFHEGAGGFASRGGLASGGFHNGFRGGAGFRGGFHGGFGGGGFHGGFGGGGFGGRR